MHPSSLLRIAVLAVLVVTVLAASGCRWFRKGNPYNQSAETRPLEVPPDLDSPNTSAALGEPTSVSRSQLAGAPGASAQAGSPTTPQPVAAQPGAAAAQPVPAQPQPSADSAGDTVLTQPGAAAAVSGDSFAVAGTRDEVFNQVGQALAGISGVTITTQAQLMGTFDVQYEGSSFLVRVSQSETGVQVAAVDPRGVAASGAAPAKLMAALKTALGG